MTDIGGWAAPTLSLVATVISVWAKKSVDDLRKQRQVRLLLPQLRAYRSLWAITEEASPSVEKEPTAVERRQLEEKFRKWYYEEGNGIFLSKESRGILVQAKQSLSNTDTIKFAEVIKTLSQLRSQLKNDLGVYGKEELAGDHKI